MAEKKWKSRQTSKQRISQDICRVHARNGECTLESILGGHVTQVKNKIANHSINQVKKMAYCRRVLSKQRVKVSGLCDIPYVSYLVKRTNQNKRVWYGDAMLVYFSCRPTWRPETSANIWSLPWLFQTLSSLC